MTTADWLALVAVVFFLLVSFFFSGSETALIASSRAAMLRLEKNGSAPRLVFLPPFRQSSPLPPEDAPAPAPTKLEIEAIPSPGHKAFLLPIGTLPAPLAEAALVNGRFQSPTGQPEIDVAHAPGVTSSFDAVIEPYHFYLDTLEDVPDGWSRGVAGSGLPLFWPLLVIWLTCPSSIAMCAGSGL